MQDTAQRLSHVRARIEAACARSGRPVSQVTLVAVSKLQPPDAIRAAHAAGQREFGENYPQELRDKANELGSLEGLRWHAIGPLQTNKAKYVAKSASVFHALDRLDLARELSARREGSALPCLIQVNVAQEASKHGVAPEALARLLDEVRELPRLEVVGLMTLPPLAEDPEATRPYFRALFELAARHQLSALSMGTTHDFEVAISEGATLVRVGTAIFGERPA
jgi:PLP dependent protein